MLSVSNRNSKPLTPYRTSRPTTSKIIFLSCEGSVTEEQYFGLFYKLYEEVRSKIQFISVAEDVVRVPARLRTREQLTLVSKNRPIQLVQRIENFKSKNEEKYQFSEYPEDEFWIVTDVDNNWSTAIINESEGKSYLDEWNDAVALCNQEGYHYAISNPFFEIWLLLHHDSVTAEDKQFAVTAEHSYEKTDYFRNRLEALGVPLKDKKKIKEEDYTRENIAAAVRRAKELHVDPTDLMPKYFSTTVYMLVDKILEMADSKQESPKDRTVE